MELLKPHFGSFRQTHIDRFINASIKNGQVWNAGECRDEYLPKFIATNKAKIKADKLKILSYQIEKGEWYRN